MGDYRWHRARALPVIASMHCHFCFTYNYHQKWPRTTFPWTGWQKSVEYAVEVTPANTSDQAGARRLLIGLKPLQPRLELIWADGSYHGEPLATWCEAEGAWRLEIIKPTPHVQGFVVRPWCWIVERTLGWLGRLRRLSKDYERKLQTSETLLKLAMIRLMLRRLARSSV